MKSTAHVFLFGDQTFDFVPGLRKLLACHDKPILNAFLEQSHYVIRAQTNLWLSPGDAQNARTSSLPDLLDKYAEGKLSPAYQVALHSLTQLGSFISYYETPGHDYPTQGSTYLVGLCTGALAAAAIASASSVSELLPAAVHTVQVALRLGLRAVDVRDSIHRPAERQSQEWSAVFFGLDEATAAKALESFNAAKALPTVSKATITACSGKTLTVSGPPSTLERLRKDPSISHCKSKMIPIYLPAHAPHIYSMNDVHQILETSKQSQWQSFNAKLPVISGATGVFVWAGGFLSLLERALCDCLLEPIRWDKVLDNLSSLMGSSGTDTIALTPIATNVEQSLSASLKNLADVAIEPLDVSGSSRLPASMQAKSKLAIVGMSGRFPESPSPEDFWKLLYDGIDTCKEVPAQRWNWRTHVTADGKGHNLAGCKWGCWLDYADQFDPKFFSISPKEAPQIDPAQRMALMTSYEALEQSGFVSNKTASSQNNRVGVFHGVTSNDYLECNSGQFIDTYFITGGNRAFIPGRINFCFEFCGPSYTNDTACSSSLAAIHLACNSLWRGDCDTAVAGGTNMCINPDGHTGLDKGFFLSRTGNCKPFDDKADGYCRGEAVSTVIIKRLDDAIAENDPILGVILDAKTNHSALSDSMTRPHVGAQIDNMKATLATSAVAASEVSYVEMHGTGTQVGDAVEMESVLKTFAPDESSRTPDNPLFVGTVKANVGHGEGVSGITSLTKVLLMMKHDMIPPHCGIKPGSKINRNYPDLAARNVQIAMSPTPWKRTTTPRKVLINNFSAAGGNTALLLEDAPLRSSPGGKDPRTSHIVTLSGHTAVSLKNNAERLLTYLRQTQEISLPQLSYTTTARRNHHLHRMSAIASTPEALIRELQAALDRGDGVNRPKSKPKILFAFTGQGAMWIAVGKQLFDGFPSFRADLESFNRIAVGMGFPAFLPLLVERDADIDQAPPVTVQLATVGLQMALSRLLLSFGVRPCAVTGHSLGMYAALNAANVLTASDTIYLVGKRAELLQQACNRGTHSMLAIKASEAAINKQLVDKEYAIACINGPEDVVISGTNDQISAAQAVLAQQNVKSMILKVPYAFHSSQVDPILSDFHSIASGASYHNPSVPVICPLLGSVVEKGGVFNAQYLRHHCRDAVDMVGALRAGVEKNLIDDKTFTIEIGPHPIVSGMVQFTLGQHMKTLPILQRNTDLWPNLTAAMRTLYNQGLDVEWSVYHAPFKSAHQVLDLPAYGWDLKSYWIAYENDWCTHKPFALKTSAGNANAAELYAKATTSGGLLPTQQNRHISEPASTATITVAPATPLPETSTVHRLVREEVDAKSAVFVFEGDLGRDDLQILARGHIVNGVPFTGPSWFADMALTVGKYAVERFCPGSHPVIDIAEVAGDKVLVPSGNEGQLVRLTFTANFDPSDPSVMRGGKFEFHAVDASGKQSSRHGLGVVRFEDRTLYKEIMAKLPDYKNKIKRLRDGIGHGEFTGYNKRSGYRLMGRVADFGPDYKLLDDMIVDEDNLEATCIVDLSNISSGGTFAAHPAAVDAMTQIGGFCVNAQESVNLDVECFIAHGWGGMQLYEELKMDRKYELYVKMVPAGKDWVKGDTVVLENGRLVAFFKDVTVHRMARKFRTAVTDAFENGTRAKPAQKPSPASKPMPKALPTTTKEPVKTFEPTVHPKESQQTAQISQNSAPARKKAGDQSRNSKAAEIIGKVMTIVAEESGLAADELTDETNFTDAGVDSLCSMVLASRLREELHLQLDPDFSIFVNCPTVQDLKTFLVNLTCGDGVDEEDQEAADTTAEPLEPGDVASYQQQDQASQDQETIAPQPRQKKELKQRSKDQSSDSIVAKAIEIVSEESGISVDDLSDDMDFVSGGIDSLCSMVISSRLREEVGLTLDADFSLFVDCPTVLDLKEFLETMDADVSSSDESTTSTATPTPASPPTEPSDDEIAQPGSDDCRPATSVILQGIPKLANKTLFMLPDGSGSAYSYVTFPQLGNDIAVVGLNCPYVRDPQDMKCSPAAMVNSFCNEIKRRQPHGPYHLGGWSAGGGFAFACARVLSEEGETIHSLTIIDAPVPEKLGTLPAEFYEYCGSLGLFGADASPTLIAHFLRTMEAMLPYKASPLKAAKMPVVGIIWASETVMNEPNPPQIDKKHFLLQQRTEFGPDGWEKLLPGADIRTTMLPGANHFTMMQKQNTPQISDMILAVMNRTPRATTPTPPASNPAQITQPPAGLPGTYIPRVDFLEAFKECKLGTDDRIRDWKIDNFAHEIMGKTNELCIALVVESFEELGCQLSQAKFGDVMPSIPFAPKHQKLVDYLYALLGKEGRLLTPANGQFVRSAVHTPTRTSDAMLKDLLQDYPSWSYALKLTHYAGKNLADVLSGKSDGLNVIFGSREGQALVTGLYCEHPVNKMCYNMMAELIGKLVANRPRDQGPLKILEMGAGTGGTTRVLAPFLQKLGFPVEYTFTDLAPQMVTAAKRTFKKYDFMRYAVHDIEKPPSAELQGQHIVIASNAIHATHDITASGANVRKALRPDGFLMMLEMTGIVPFIDIIFGLLEGWWLFNDGRSHAIAPASLWEEKLLSVGFGKVDWTDGDLPENELQRVIVALAL